MNAHYYTVVNYHDSGQERCRRDALSIGEAYEKARETPHSVVERISRDGWVQWTRVFSPKHPCPAFPS